MGTIEALWGIGQIYGLFISNHTWYAQTGSFYNPGPYAGFLALCLPVCFHARLRPTTKKNSILQRTGLFTTILILCILPSTMSRTAWIAACISGIYITIKCGTFPTKEFRDKINQYFKLSSVFLVLMFACIFIFLYFIKKDSANGRFLMWKIATQAIIKKPLTGYGWDCVAGAYGNAQEIYFSEGNFTEAEAYVAGAPEYIFNEYLQIAMAWGIPALLFILTLFYACFIFLKKEKEYGLCGSLISLSVFSFASYPFQFIEFITAALLLLTSGLIACKRYCSPNIRYLLYTIIACITLTYCLTGKIKHERYKQTNLWKNIQTYYHAGAYKEAIEKYSNLYETMQWNGLFLFEYGHSLHETGQYEKSNKILSQALCFSSEPMILNIIGKNHQALNNYKLAEWYFSRSKNRIPNRIYPYYLLFNLYKSTNVFPKEKAQQVARTIVEKAPKVQSTATKEMKDEARKYLLEMNNAD